MSNRLSSIAACLFLLAFAACEKPSSVPEPQPAVSTVDPLPLPPEMETNKDLSVHPGDSFFDYCNGTWLKSNPIPSIGAVGGIYDGDGPMAKRLEELKASVPDIGHFSQLKSNMHAQPDKSRAYIDARKAQYPKPATREEAFRAMGRMIRDGIAPWVSNLPRWSLNMKDGKVVGLLEPPTVNPGQTPPNPDNLVYLSFTKADEGSALSLILQGMGLDATFIVTDPSQESGWKRLEDCTLEDLCQCIDDAWQSYGMFVSQEEMETVHASKIFAEHCARLSLNYSLSYHLSQRYISPADKEKFVRITREIQASLRNRIQAVTWMSETTRRNAIDKLDSYSLYVAYPDQWHMDCISKLSDCETLVEAVDRNNRCNARLMQELLGSNDGFSTMMIRCYPTGKDTFLYTDLSLVNAMYDPEMNGVFIYPAIMLPPIMPSGVSEACIYATYAIIGHEFTHGFDANGSRYDKYGNQRNWWTISDQMAFEERCQNLIQCYNHMELDPEREPGVHGNGTRTLSENIADMGGFLVSLDAYRNRLESDGYFGKEYEDQLRKFFESYAHFWCVLYSDSTLENLKSQNVHSHARLRVNGVVMNTDLWYELYNVDRDNYLYLPPERRSYIW